MGIKKNKKAYKNKILFLRKSKKGGHLYAFNNDNALGGEVESLVLNISDVKAVIEDTAKYAKVSVMVPEKEEEQAALPTKPEEI